MARLNQIEIRESEVTYSTEKGTPQGGVVSPLLANVVLNKLAWFLHDQGSHTKVRDRGSPAGLANVRFARYADD